MSDFDAEAERKRLREKYEAEEESRKQTQQMSELLLKGATMTNRHCGECGSPIFRYEDQEFCPNCQRTAEGETADGTDAAEAPSTDATHASEPADSDTESPGEAARPNPGESATETGTDVAPETPAAGDVAASNGVADAGSATDPDRGRDTGRGIVDRAVAGNRSDPAVEPTAGDDGTPPSRRIARESLLAALTRHARLAADTDEPRRATDHLKAAREAAAALDELDGS